MMDANAPVECRTLRRAVLVVNALTELNSLTEATKIIYQRFDDARWQWFVTVEHDVLPLLVPGHEAYRWSSVDAFNRMIEQRIAAAIAGEQPPADAQSVQQQAQRLFYPSWAGLSGTITAPNTIGLGGLLGGTQQGWNTTSSGNTTP